MAGRCQCVRNRRNFLVNDVDVTAFVEAQLDERRPERVQLRQMHTAADYGGMWHTVERLWSETVARAERLPEAALHERVDDEWSFVETLRHLVFATDAWASRTVLDEPMPYHRLGLTHTSYPPADAVALGIDLEARPSFAEVMECARTASHWSAAWSAVSTTTSSNGSVRVRQHPDIRGIAHSRALPPRRDG